MVDPAGFGGTDIETASVDVNELTSTTKRTSFSRQLEGDEQYSGEIELPVEWAEHRFPVEVLEEKIENEIYDILSQGAEGLEELGTQDFDAYIRDVNPEAEDDRIVSEVFLPVDPYETPEGVGSTGVIAYEALFNPKKEDDWQPNTQGETFRYRKVDEIGGERVRNLLFDGLYEDENRRMRPEWDSEDEVPGYDGSITVDYSNPI